MRAFLEGQPCLIRNPSAYRPWQFVLEPLRGYLMLAERLAEDGPRFASGWNFGPVDSDVQPVSWISDELVRLWGSGAAWALDSAAHPHEAHALKLDAPKPPLACIGGPCSRSNRRSPGSPIGIKDSGAGADLQQLTARSRSSVTRPWPATPADRHTPKVSEPTRCY